ncbi:MAG: ketoacyl-ACP synthase III [Bacteroidales bacterium]|nr:ketoacyl-ACP synthase III [Bacteroidales bacterium]
MKIIGTGSALPRKTVSNDDLSQFLDTSDEWITTRTGIKTRQIITDERFEDLAIEAARRALEASHLDPKDIDYIVTSNVGNSYVTPSVSSLVQGALGCSCPTMDINSACAGFIYGMDLVESFMQSGRATNVLLLAAEAVTRFVDWTMRETCVLFGDGAGAVVAQKSDNLLGMKLTSIPLPEVIWYQRPLEHTPFETGTGVDTHHPMTLKGREVFRMAVTSASHDLKEVVEKAGLELDQVDHFVLHQANKRIIDAIQENLGLPAKKFHSNICKRGNTSSASVPILLDELVRDGVIHDGEIVAFSAFGAGFVTGTCVMRW